MVSIWGHQSRGEPYRRRGRIIGSLRPLHEGRARALPWRPDDDRHELRRHLLQASNVATRIIRSGRDLSRPPRAFDFGCGMPSEARILQLGRLLGMVVNADKL